MSAAPTVRPAEVRGGTRGVLRVGVVPYLNVTPIVHGLQGDPRFELSREVPSRLAQRLHEGELDLGTIPTIEYPGHDYAIVPGVAITSRGAVRSVKLFHRKPLGEARRVALDTSSRTSVALLRVVAREVLPAAVEFTRAEPDVEAMLRVADAALVIGDPALYYEGDAGGLDMGELWTRLTNLPFVWAFWAGPRGRVSPGDVAALQRSQEQGIAAIPQIAASYNGASAARAALNATYLRHNIVFRLGDDELAGLREFWRRAAGLGIVPEAPEPRFHGHS